MTSSLPLLAVGAGLAGLTAANRALELGRRAVVLERSAEPRHLCASRTNGGVFHVGFRSVMSEPDELVDVILRATGGFTDAALARSLAENTRRSIEWLQDIGTEFTSLQPHDNWKDFVLAPLGFHDKTTMNWEGLGADRLIDRLENRVRELGGEVRRGYHARELIVDDGVVTGIVANGPRGTELLRADAVVLCDGGFEGNQAMIRKYITAEPRNLKLRGTESGLGDGMRMAAAAGASLVGMASFYGHILSADSLTLDTLSPFPFLDFLASTGMLVDMNGDRFVDETAGGHFTSNALARRGDGLGYVIFDDAMWNGIGRHFFAPPNPNLVEGGGTLHKADSIEELADLTALPRDKILAHVAEREKEVANASVSTAQKEAMTAFAKGKHPHERFAKAPYYAVPVCAALTSTLGGLAVDPRGRVLRADGSAIEGLFAAGSTTGGIEGGPEVGYLGGLIKALVFGLLAAEEFCAIRK